LLTSDSELGKLAKRLRALRLDAGLTTYDVARIVGWSQPKVSRTETGIRCPTTADVRAWARAVGASKRTTSDLVAQARRARVQYVEWKDSRRKETRQFEPLAMENASERIRIFAPMFIPGLVQTPEYARHVLASVFRLPPDDPEIAGAVALRLERQRVAHTSGKTIAMIVAEDVLHRLVCPRRVLAEQLERLITVADLPSIDLSVIASDAELTMWSNEFVFFDDDAVFVETIGGSLHHRDPQAVGRYEATFEALQECAVRGPEARAIIERALTACTAPTAAIRRP